MLCSSVASSSTQLVVVDSYDRTRQLVTAHTAQQRQAWDTTQNKSCLRGKRTRSPLVPASGAKRISSNCCESPTASPTANIPKRLLALPPAAAAAAFSLTAVHCAYAARCSGARRAAARGWACACLHPAAPPLLHGVRALSFDQMAAAAVAALSKEEVSRPAGAPK